MTVAGRGFRPLRLAARAMLLAFGLSGLGAWTPGSALPVMMGTAWADDDGASGSDDGGGSDSGGDGPTAGDSSEGLGNAPRRPAIRVVPERFLADELIAIQPSPAALQRAQTLMGAQVLGTARLPRLGMTVVRLGLHGIDPVTARDVLNERDAGVFALHHLVGIAQDATPSAPCEGPACTQKRVLQWPLDSRTCGIGQRVGMVDTAVDTRHPALREARIQTRDWVSSGRHAVQDGHGTAIAAMLVGQPGSVYEGLLPQATLLAAHPFFAMPSGQVRADTWGLLHSLEWLAREGVTVIGLSLTGDDDPALALAMARLQSLGIVVVAAAGNGGQRAGPAYPAAYPGVLAATAITPQTGPYRRANRGDYIQYALPGANLTIVTADGGLTQGSGTSYAVPFLVGVIAQSAREGLVDRQNWALGQGVPRRDLGAPGKDAVFGWGLPQVPVRCR